MAINMPKAKTAPTEFTLFNCIAYDLYRKSHLPKIVPCWLCLSNEAKEEAQAAAIDWLNTNITPRLGLIVPFQLATPEITERLLQQSCGAAMEPMRQQWEAAERDREQGRKENNPLAFFAA